METVVALSMMAAAAGAEAPEGRFDAARGAWQYRVTSPFLAGTNLVEVLLPDALGPAERCRVLFVLPVEEGEGRRYGDPLKVLAGLGVHNRHRLILVVPSFPVAPWYGNHASEAGRRCEDYLVRTVVPLVEGRHPARGTLESRLLLGFSKSGWGALTLILRHPEVFGYAASWDAPLMMTERQFGIWGTDAAFGTASNMAAHLPTVLARERGGPFRERSRIVLAGKNLFGTLSDQRFPYVGPSQTEAFHEWLEARGVKHRYDAGLAAPHSWNAKWVGPVVDMLMAAAGEENKETVR